MSVLNPEPSIDIRVLGPMVVRVGRHERTPAGGLPRTVLSVLVARLGSSIDSDALIDAVWDGSPPRSARSALRVHISRIREAVGVDSLIVTTHRGYRLDADPQSIDAYRFEMGVGEGRRLLQSGSYGPAATMLASALREWRDSPYQDGRSVQVLESETRRLSTLRTEAAVDLAVAEMEQARGHPDIAAIEQLVANDHLDERRWGLLMKALYRSGRQADALAAFKRARQALGDELGIEPGPELRDLEEQILLHDPALSPGDPTGRVNLPGFATELVGRADQVSALAKEMVVHRVVTVTGLGGVGKTRLAVSAARAALPDFPGGAVFVPLDPLAESGSVVDAVATGLGVPASPGDPAESLAAHLDGDRVVLVLDNCEHVVGEAARLVAELIAACPAVVVLATSRVPLEVTGETIFPLRPLEVPPPGLADTPRDMLAFESVALFCERARQVRTDFSLDADNGPVIAEIVRRLAGVPLSIEIAAAQSDVHTPAEILARLEARPSEHVAGERDRPIRHRSMANAVAWSLELLDAPAQELFERLAVFGSPVDADTIEAVCSDGSLPPGGVRSALASLTRASLLTVDLDGARARYSQLPPIREVALGLLDAGEGALRSRHLAHYAREAAREAGHVGGPDELESFRRITAAINEYRSALGQAWADDRPQGARLCVDLGTYWIRSGRTREARMWVDRFLQRGGDFDRSVEAALLHLAGSLALVERDVELADQRLTAALEIRRASNSPRESGMTLSNLGSVANARGDYSRAEAMYREALEEFEASGFERGRVASWLNIGVVLTNLDRMEEAIETFERAVAGARRIGDRSEEAQALSRLGYAYASRGDLARAEACRMASHHITEELGRSPDIAWSHMNLAAHHLETGDLDRARLHAGKSAHIVSADELERWWVPDLLELAAHIAAEAGDATLGARLFGCATTHRERRRIAIPQASLDFVAATEERLKAALGSDDWMVAFEIGRASRLDQALETIATWADS